MKITLNIAALFFLVLFSFLSWQLLTVCTQKLRCDYATFYKTFSQDHQFYQFYTAVDVVGASSILQKPVTYINNERTSFNLNTPLMTLVLKEIVTVSDNLQKQTAVWVIAALFCAGLSILILQNTIVLSTHAHRYFLLILLALWMNWFALFNTAAGQIAFFLLPLLCLIFYLDHLKRYGSSAILIGLMASLKLFFLLFLLLYCVRRQWRYFVIAATAFIFFFFLPLLSMHWENYQLFFHLNAFSWGIVNRATSGLNGTLLGFVGNVFRRFYLHPSLLVIAIPTIFLTLLILLSGLIFNNRVIRYLPAFSDELQFCFFIVLTLLCSPLGWMYYYIFLLIPAWVIFAIAGQFTLSKRFFIYFTAALFLPYFTSIDGSSVLSEVVQRFSVFIALLCWLASLFLLSDAVHKSEKNIHGGQALIITIIVLYILTGITLLSYNKGLVDFLNIDKTHYMKTEPQGIWLSSADQKRLTRDRKITGSAKNIQQW